MRRKLRRITTIISLWIYYTRWPGCWIHYDRLPGRAHRVARFHRYLFNKAMKIVFIPVLRKMLWEHKSPLMAAIELHDAIQREKRSV